VPRLLDSFSLSGKVALVTGASSGLGVDIAQGLAEAGAAVGICGRREDRLAEVREAVERHGPCLAFRTDVSDPDDCERFVAAAVAEFGKVDILVNNAGVAGAAPATREAPEHFQRIVEINLHGSYFMAQATGRVMGPGSSIINMGSVLGLTTAGLPQAAYASSKAAIIGLTRDLAQQWMSRKGIRVNALAPGFFASEMTDRYPDGYLEGQLGRVPAGRIGDARELVLATLFLASDASSYVTGVVLPVDGGLLTT
jgi:NAD(P)-dependent dehydrogenase (short-subunit alcohol dehydrogenase family)